MIDALRESFLLRWIVANVLGWTVGLYLGFLNPICFAGAGIIAGLALGAAQWWVLTRSPTLLTETELDHSWIWVTLGSAAVGLIPSLLIGGLLALLAGWGMGLLIGGAILGGSVGIGQWYRVRHSVNQAEMWIGANVLGGALCGLLTSIPIIRGLPLGLLIGSALYGYITGRALERMTMADE
jgi:hypothetical protein